MRTLDIILSNVPDQEQSEAIRLAVEEGGHHGLEATEQNSRGGMTGRLSTLEIAYEELEEEIRELRAAFTECQLQQVQKLDQQQLQMRWLGGLSIAGLVALVWLVTWQGGGVLDEYIARTDEQFSLLHSIVGGVIELIGR